MNEPTLRASSEIILPPGSTSADLQAAIDGASPGDVITLSDDMPFINTVTVPSGMEITIQSDTGSNRIMSSPGANIRHFRNTGGNITFRNITLDGGGIGGGILNTGGSLKLDGGSILQGCVTSVFNGLGGGIVMRGGGSLTMSGTSAILNCIATSYGGGVYLNDGSFEMSGGALIENCSAATGNDRYGGGVYMNNGSSFAMSGDTVISGCAANHGGGVYLNNSSFTMSDNATIKSCSASFYTANSMGGGVAIFNNGTFIMNDSAVIKDCMSVFRGGGINLTDSTNITLNDRSMLDNCTAPFGGGVYMSNSSFTMRNGVVIQNCTADEYGGGFRISNSMIIMEDNATIKGCTAIARFGGGLVVSISSTLIMSDGTAIIDCKANTNGGGVYLTQNSRVDMSGGVISNNYANIDGGGVYILSGSMEIKGSSYIVDNNAVNGGGGGIFTADTTYANLSVAGDTVFNRNRAAAAYIPPPDASVLYPNIQFASVSITNHPLNNFDINYIGDMPAKFNITYNANGGMGSHKGPDISPDEADIVLSPQETKISRAGYTFVVWNTEPNGGGVPFLPGETIILDSDKVLYAQWAAEPRTFTITYDCNGGIGRYTDHCREFDVNYTVLSISQTGISNTGYIFSSWNTAPDGSGISYAARALINVNDDMTLYAQWRRIPAQKRMCRAPVTKCRTSIEGQKLWVDNDNAGNTRPQYVEILLIRDGEVYKRTTVASAGDGYFGFCCIPVWKNSAHKYSYQVDEMPVSGYTKTIEGFNIINTLIP